MNVIDIIILVCCIPAIVSGFSKGFVSQAFSLVALVLGVWLSFKFSVVFGDWLKTYADLPGTILHVIAFAVILLIVVLLLKTIGNLVEKLIKVVMLGWLNKLLGVVFSLVKVVLVSGIVITLFDAVYTHLPFVSSDTLEESLFYYPIKNIADTVFPFLKELIFNK